MANSSMLVLPSSTAPASRRRLTAVPSYGGVKPSRILDAQVVGTPSVRSTSLSATGMPRSFESVSPVAILASARRASSMPCSRHTAR